MYLLTVCRLLIPKMSLTILLSLCHIRRLLQRLSAPTITAQNMIIDIFSSFSKQHFFAVFYAHILGSSSYAIERRSGCGIAQRRGGAGTGKVHEKEIDQRQRPGKPKKAGASPASLICKGPPLRRDGGDSPSGLKLIRRPSRSKSKT